MAEENSRISTKCPVVFSSSAVKLMSESAVGRTFKPIFTALYCVWVVFSLLFCSYLMFSFCLNAPSHLKIHTVKHLLQGNAVMIKLNRYNQNSASYIQLKHSYCIVSKY